MVFKTNYRLMQVKSIAECSKGSILHNFRPSLSYHLSLRSLFCLFLRFYCILCFFLLLFRMTTVLNILCVTVKLKDGGSLCQRLIVSLREREPHSGVLLVVSNFSVFAGIFSSPDQNR